MRPTVQTPRPHDPPGRPADVGRTEPRSVWLRRAYALAVTTLAWNVIEGLVAVASGLAAGSVALLGFGIDSFIETASAAVAAWRTRSELSGRTRGPEHVERIERRASRVAGTLLLVLAAYVLFDAGRRLLGAGRHAEESWVGIILTAVSLAIMPVLGRMKLRAAAELGSSALRADAYETITCAWLSLTTLGGLLLNAAFGWWWADPAAALLLIPLIVREGLEAVRGRCTCHAG